MGRALMLDTRTLTDFFLKLVNAHDQVPILPAHVRLVPTATNLQCAHACGRLFSWTFMLCQIVFKGEQVLLGFW